MNTLRGMGSAWRFRIALAVMALLLAGAAVFTVHTSLDPTTIGPTATLAPVSDRPSAPEFTGVDAWINAHPLTVQALRGKVVLIDFWTFSCVNCTRTVPHLQELYSRYRARGFEIVGVHSPEFDFEKDANNVRAAVQRLGVTWPVAVDSEMSTWNAYRNQYWPAEYLIDQQGRLAYHHDGEGDYSATDAAVAGLLGVQQPSSAPATAPSADITPELYAGSGRGQLDNESYGADGSTQQYGDAHPSDPDTILVTGAWADHREYLESRSPGHVRLRFHAHDVYIVAGSASGHSLALTVTLDGTQVPAAAHGPDLHGDSLTVTRNDLFHLVSGEDAGQVHEIDIAVPTGLQLFTFTFG